MEHLVKGATDSFTEIATNKCNKLSDTVGHHVQNATGESIRTKCLASIHNIVNNDTDNTISTWTSSCDEHVSNETDGNESESQANGLADLFSKGSNLKKELHDHWTEMWDKVYVSFKETSEESETGASEKDTPEDSEKDTPEGESDEPETGTSGDSAKGTPQDSEKDSQKGASDETEESDSDDTEKSTSKDSDKSKDSEKSDAKDKTLKLFDDSIHKDETGFRVTTPTLLGASLLLVSGLVVLRSWGAGRGLVGGEEELEHLAELESVEA